MSVMLICGLAGDTIKYSFWAIPLLGSGPLKPNHIEEREEYNSNWNSDLEMQVIISFGDELD